MKDLKKLLMSEESPMPKEEKKKMMSKEDMKMMILKSLKDEMDQLMKMDMSDGEEMPKQIEKVSVMADSPENLEKGLDKAKELLNKKKLDDDVPTDEEESMLEDDEDDEEDKE